ncbi:MAG: hypothetical protein M5U07_25540 [Xanthobacteraceae bacterium]|nr:hypothetical protein [Xanthobacteraceae bacterium]
MSRKPDGRKPDDSPADPQDERLREVGRRWFAEARQRSEHDDAELAHWRREWKKWHGQRTDPSRVFEDYWLRGADDLDAPAPPPQAKRSTP